jgi:hypothetical protein
VLTYSKVISTGAVIIKAVMSFCVQVIVWTYTRSFLKYLWVELLGHVVGVYLTF